MTPKFIEVTHFRTGVKHMVNPRRLDAFYKMPSPSQQPDLECGTGLNFGRGEVLVVRETVQEIVTKLNK